jgi:hypothetical protein
MLDAKVDQEVVKAYVKNSTTPYNLSAADIISLKEHGVPDELVAAMLQRGGELRAQVPPQQQIPPQQPPTQYGPAPIYPTGYDYANYSPPYTDSGYGYPYSYVSYPYPYYYGYNYWYPWAYYAPFYCGFHGCYHYGHYHGCYAYNNHGYYSHGGNSHWGSPHSGANHFVGGSHTGTFVNHGQPWMPVGNSGSHFAGTRSFGGRSMTMVSHGTSVGHAIAFNGGFHGGGGGFHGGGGGGHSGGGHR